MNADEVYTWMLMRKSFLAMLADPDASYPDADPDAA